MVIVFMALIISKRLSPISALIIIPIVFGLLAGFRNELGQMMLDGIGKLAPTGVMLMFAILYFAIMIDCGLFDPLVKQLVRIVHDDPVRIVVGTAALALIVSLDGDGSTTYMITTAAMLPLYQRLGLRPVVLTCVVMMAGGVMNITPWGGPTARAASALSIDSAEIFVPMIPAMVVSSLFVLWAAYRLGLVERQRIAEGSGNGLIADDLSRSVSFELDVGNADGSGSQRQLRGLQFINGGLTLLLMTALIMGIMPLPVLFMIAFAIALVLNYPSVNAQKALMARHAGNVLAVVGLIFAAGIFTGILTGTKMVDAMAATVITAMPESLGPHLSVVTGLVSIPFTFFISNDAFYYGVLPILAKAGEAYGITAAEIGRASIIGQPVHLLSPLVPSTYLLVGLVGVEFGDHQRFTFKWCLLTSLVMLAVGLLTAVIPFVGQVISK